MLVIVGDALVEELVEGGVGVVGAGVDTNSGVLVLNSGEDASLERNAFFAFHVLVLLPDLLGKALLELRFALRGEESVPILEIVSRFESCLFLGGLGDSVF